MATTSDVNNAIDISQGDYIAFEATSLKQLFKTRLDAGGVFTDQDYEGSNLNALLDTIAYTFHTLMFYMNKTSNESMFSEAQLYENMNKIVKALDYKPIGNQTATLTFSLTAPTLTNGPTYTIPRYTYFRINNIGYSFNEDVTFTKTTSSAQILDNVGDEYLLYQGRYQEFPVYTALGQDNEIVYLTPGDSVIVDHFNIDVYVNDITTGLWTQWTSTPSLFLEKATSTSYEIRLNQNQRYEIKFGNNINGKGLNTGDQVAIYFLQSDGQAGELGVSPNSTNNGLAGKKATLFQTVQFNTILPNILSAGTTSISQNNLSLLQFSNDNASTQFNPPETVDSVRQNSPSLFRSQYRLVTPDDYENFVQTNFANFIIDAAVYNNWDYLTKHIKYLYSIGLSKPNEEARVFLNQVSFSTACNFNNIYIYCVPKSQSVYNQVLNYLAPAQKQLIMNSILNQKGVTSEIIVSDPVYIACTVAYTIPGTTPSLTDVANTQLVINLTPNAKIDPTFVQNSIQNIFATYFNPATLVLGQTLDISNLNNQILAITGVASIVTQRIDTANSSEGLSFLLWNPSYPNGDIGLYTQNTTLDTFKFLYLNNITDLISRLAIVATNTNSSVVEF